ncbi:MAG: sterol desaturase family protein [Vicinamibacterales bacterium]
MAGFEVSTEDQWGLLNRWGAPSAVAALITLAARALVSYGTHYAMHAVPGLWRLHRVHHLDTELDVTTTVRFHPFELVVQTLPGVGAALAVGFVPWVLVFYETLDVVVTLWTHSNLTLPPAVNHVLRYAIVTPDTHRIHHSAWAPETNSNYGAVFPWWDLVFGTFTVRSREPQRAMRLGLDEVRGAAAHRAWWLFRSVWTRRLTDASDAGRVEVGER